MSLTLKELAVFLQLFLSNFQLFKRNTRSELEASRETQSNLHEATGAVGDEKHLLAVISQLGQYRAGLFGVADVLF